MLNHIRPSEIIFLDIETASCVQNYSDLDNRMKTLWDQKVQYRLKDGELPETYFEREAGLHAEFGRVVCVSLGKLVQSKSDPTCANLKISSLFGSEKEILEKLSSYLRKLSPQTWICAFNGKEFDFPFLSRRMLINAVLLPDHFDLSNKKPWDARLLDPMDLWKFGERKHYCKMDLLAALFDIPSSKSDMEGADVSKSFWKGKINEIVTYCQKDILVLVNIVLRFMSAGQIADCDVIFVEPGQSHES